MLDAGLAVLREGSYDLLTIRAVAARASVTHTTAYHYFSSKAHLVSEIYRRQMGTVPMPVIEPGASFVDRVAAAFEGPAIALAAEPELAHAMMVALLSREPEIREVREALGRDLVERVRLALGDGVDPDLLEVLLMAYSGAMITVSTGSQDFTSVVRRMRTLAASIDPS